MWLLWFQKCWLKRQKVCEKMHDKILMNKNSLKLFETLMVKFENNVSQQTLKTSWKIHPVIKTTNEARHIPSSQPILSTSHDGSYSIYILTVKISLQHFPGLINPRAQSVIKNNALCLYLFVRKLNHF